MNVAVAVAVAVAVGVKVAVAADYVYSWDTVLVTCGETPPSKTADTVCA